MCKTILSRDIDLAPEDLKLALEAASAECLSATLPIDPGQYGRPALLDT